MTVQPRERHRPPIDGAAAPAGRGYHAEAAARRLTAAQLTAIQTAMQILIEDDLYRGVSPEAVDFCTTCDAWRPLAGLIRYGDFALCNDCATEYEVAQIAGLVSDPDQFMRDRSLR